MNVSQTVLVYLVLRIVTFSESESGQHNPAVILQ